MRISYKMFFFHRCLASPSHIWSAFCSKPAQIFLQIAFFFLAALNPSCSWPGVARRDEEAPRRSCPRQAPPPPDVGCRNQWNRKMPALWVMRSLTYKDASIVVPPLFTFKDLLNGNCDGYLGLLWNLVKLPVDDHPAQEHEEPSSAAIYHGHYRQQ